LPGVDAPLARRLEQARAEASKAGAGETYFAAYLFQSRHKVRYGVGTDSTEPYSVTAPKSRIRIIEKSRDRYDTDTSTDEKDAPSPAAALALCETKSGAILDISLLDPERVYEFKVVPVVWVGEASGEESLAFATKTFEAGGDRHLRNSLLFLVSCHPGPQAPAALKRFAMGG
jgi:hypothetical protein